MRFPALMLVVLVGCSVPPSARANESARALAAEIDGEQVFADVRALTALHASDLPRACTTAPATRQCHHTHDSARRFVIERLASLGLVVREDGPDELGMNNVFAEVRGTSRPDEVILVGAHFDAFFEGADDNSTGVAVMLELARVVAAHPLACTVLFVGFDLEELGMLGSTKFRAAMARGPKVALALDMLGYTGPQTGLVGFPVPADGNFLAAIANDVSRPQVEQLLQVVRGEDVPPIQAIVAPGRGDGPLTGNLMRSDHAPFWLAGDAAVFFTDTSNFRNPHLHLASDTADTLDPEFLTGSARISAMAIAVWSEE